MRFVAIFLIVILWSNPSSAEVGRSIFGLSLGAPYLSGIDILKERKMFGETAQNGRLVSGKYKKCDYLWLNFDQTKPCINVNFEAVKLKKDMAKSGWKIGNITYQQQFSPSIDEKALLVKLTDRYGKFQDVTKVDGWHGRFSETRDYLSILTNGPFTVEDIDGTTFFTEFRKRLAQRKCSDEVTIIRVTTFNKAGQTLHLEVKLEDLQLTCMQHAAWDAYRAREAKKSIEKQLKLD